MSCEWCEVNSHFKVIILGCLYKARAEEELRVSKLEYELNCKTDLIEKIKQKLAAEVRQRYLSVLQRAIFIILRLTTNPS